MSINRKRVFIYFIALLFLGAAFIFAFENQKSLKDQNSRGAVDEKFAWEKINTGWRYRNRVYDFEMNLSEDWVPDFSGANEAYFSFYDQRAQSQEETLILEQGIKIEIYVGTKGENVPLEDYLTSQGSTFEVLEDLEAGGRRALRLTTASLGRGAWTVVDHGKTVITVTGFFGSPPTEQSFQMRYNEVVAGIKLGTN